jgi:hypothetical protein
MASTWHGYATSKLSRTGKTLVKVPNTLKFLLGEYAKLSWDDMMQGANRYIDGIFMYLTFF